MVSPAHIREAEKFGMPVVEPEVLRCRQCDAKRKDDDIDKCDDCGRECCPKCWVWIPDVALRFCSESCARTRLLKLLAAAEMNERPITEHPDVQRLVGQVVELQAEIKGLKETCRRIEVITNMSENLDSATELQLDLKIIGRMAALKGDSDG